MIGDDDVVGINPESFCNLDLVSVEPRLRDRTSATSGDSQPENPLVGNLQVVDAIVECKLPRAVDAILEKRWRY